MQSVDPLPDPWLIGARIAQAIVGSLAKETPPLWHFDPRPMAKQRSRARATATVEETAAFVNRIVGG